MVIGMTKRKIAIFAGTYEGHELAVFLEKYLQRENGMWAQVWVFVATEYGAQVLEGLSQVQIVCGRKTPEEIADFLSKHQVELVIDATHPFAREISANLREVCQKHGIWLERLRRDMAIPEEERQQGIAKGTLVEVDNMSQAIDWLENRPGAIFATTGSKEAGCYTRLCQFEERVVLRVLPGKEIREELLQLGFSEERLIQQEGPFSEAENAEMMGRWNIRYLVTKDSGAHSGVLEKYRAAQQLGVTTVLLRRTPEQGKSFMEVRELLQQFLCGETGES